MGGDYTLTYYRAQRGRRSAYDRSAIVAWTEGIVFKMREMREMMVVPVFISGHTKHHHALKTIPLFSNLILQIP